MSVQVETSKYKDKNISYTLSFTNPLVVASLPSIEPNASGIVMNLTEEDAQELHNLLGEKLLCVDCSCVEYGSECAK